MANKVARAVGGNGGFKPGGNGSERFNPGQPDVRFAAEQGTTNPSVVGSSFQLGKDSVVQNQRMSIPQASFLRPQEMTKGQPRGAQAIKVVGMTPQAQGQGGGLRLGAPAGNTQAIKGPASSPFGRGGAPLLPQRPASPALSGPALGAGEEIHRIEVRGRAPDGMEHVATFDAVFPKNTTMLGASEIPKE